jgi:hypothetical protein
MRLATRAKAWAGRTLVRALPCIGLLALGCRSTREHPIELVVGNAPDQHLSFTPEASFAEYVEVPGSGSELRLTLAGYPSSCEHFKLPGPKQPLVTTVILTPPGTTLHADVYGWDGHAAHGGTAASPERAYAIPSARIGHQSFVFPPGGSIRLSEVNLERAGKISGILAFEFAGNAEREAARISGNFEARLCHVRFADTP